MSDNDYAIAFPLWSEKAVRTVNKWDEAFIYFAAFVVPFFIGGYLFPKGQYGWLLEMFWAAFGIAAIIIHWRTVYLATKVKELEEAYYKRLKDCNDLVAEVERLRSRSADTEPRRYFLFPSTEWTAFKRSCLSELEAADPLGFRSRAVRRQRAAGSQAPVKPKSLRNQRHGSTRGNDTGHNVVARA